MLWLDTETYSAAPIKDVGGYGYAYHPSTEILLVAYAIDDGPVQVWDCTLDDSRPLDLMAAYAEVKRGDRLICTHNSMFDRPVLTAKGYSFPLEQWRDSAVKALTLGLPASLDQLGRCLGLPLDQAKLTIGKRLIQRFSVPAPANHKAARYTRDTHPKEWAQFIEYAARDVEAMRTLYKQMPDWNYRNSELQLWFLDQRINDRGMPVDMPLVEAAIDLVAGARKRLNAELKQATKGLVAAASNAAQLTKWVNSRGINTERMTGADVTELLARNDLPADVRRALEIRAEAGKSSVAKYDKLKTATMADARVRGTLQFCGASRTGRWGGRLFQPQNLTRPTVDIDAGCNAILNGTVDLLFDSAMEVAASCIRGVIKAPEGYRLVVSDLAGIEGRVLPWLCGFKKKVQAIADGLDMYKVAASGIYGIKYEAVTKEQRFIGKVAELALGYQGGVNALQQMARAYGVELDEDLAQTTVSAWRDANAPIKNFWYSTEEAAINAVSHPATTYTAGRLQFNYDRQTDFLRIKLPSNRLLCYYQPVLIDSLMPWGEYKQQLNFTGVNQVTRNIEVSSTYGGKLCLSGDTLVLSESGWVRITELLPGAKVWDGESWAEHSGVVMNGYANTVSVCGVRMTEDHKVLTTGGWISASQSEGRYRVESRLPDRFTVFGELWKDIPVSCSVRLRERDNYDASRTNQTGETRRAGFMRLQTWRKHIKAANKTRYVKAPGVRSLAQHVGPLQAAFASSLAQLRGAWNIRVRPLEGIVREFLGGHGAYLPAWSYVGPQGQQRGVHAGELQVDHPNGSSEQQAWQPCAPKRANSSPSSKGERHRGNDNTLQAGSRLAMGAGYIDEAGFPQQEPVYDIINCGPRNRFVVRCHDGSPLIVHNCENITQAVARDVLAANLPKVEAAGFEVIGSVHDEIITLAPEDSALDHQTLSALLATQPEWADGLPLAAEGYTSVRYQK